MNEKGICILSITGLLLMNSKQFQVPERDLHKIKSVNNIVTQERERPMIPLPQTEMLLTVDWDSGKGKSAFFSFSFFSFLFFFVLFCFVLFFLRQGFRVFLCNSPSCPGTRSCRPNWPWIHRDPPASWVLGLEVCAIAWLEWVFSKGVSHGKLNMF